MRRFVSFFLLAALLCSLLPGLGETGIEETVLGGTRLNEIGTAADTAATQIVITFAGDCTLGCDPRERGKATGFESYIEQYGYGYPFEKVKQYFEQDDLSVVNLEGTFYNHDLNLKANVKYHFRGSTDLVNILTESSIEACSIANNHITDYGEPGLRSTIQTLENAGVHWFGTLSSGVEGTYIFEKNGVKIGFVAVYTSDWWVPGTPTKLKEQLQALKDEGCSLLIACMHAGVEYDTRHSSTQEQMADRLIRYGAQIVVGTHTHTVQGVREDGGVCTLWSLGNFVFGGNSSVYVTQPKNAHYGDMNINTCIAQFTLSFDENGEYLGHQLNLIPCYVSGEMDYNNYQPVPVTGTDAKKVLKAIQDDSSPRSLVLSPLVEGVGSIQDFVPAPTPAPTPTPTPAPTPVPTE